MIKLPTEARIAVAVAVGSGLGGVARVLVGIAVLRLMGDHFPFGVLAVNIAGSFLIGFLATFTGPAARLMVRAATRQFLLAGLCGGFTTFSFFSLQTLLLLEAGRFVAAATYSAATLLLGMLAVWLGHALAAYFNRL